MDMETVVEMVNVTKQYGKECALQNVSLTLEKGKLYGLIGQNGAGKTTLMRILTGLSYAQEGEVSLFGKQGEHDLQEARKQVGALIEHPCILPNLSALENLVFHKKLRGIQTAGLEVSLLTKVGLSSIDKKKVRSFSLGMKQRLGIAISLLSSPRLLILDEPINGLDPIGVVDIRKLLIQLCKEENITILLSSHNLPELYQVATEYFLMNKGRIVEHCTLEELEEKGSKESSIESYVVSMIGGSAHA